MRRGAQKALADAGRPYSLPQAVQLPSVFCRQKEVAHGPRDWNQRLEPGLLKPAKCLSSPSFPSLSGWLQPRLSPSEIALATGDVDDFFHLVLMFISCPSISARIRTDEVLIYRLCIFTLGNYKPFPCSVRVVRIHFGN